jgi:hypothetical protein
MAIPNLNYSLLKRKKKLIVKGWLVMTTTLVLSNNCGIKMYFSTLLLPILPPE